MENLEFKGTKGNWEAVDYAGIFMIQSGGYYGDANILDVQDCQSTEEWEANAKLIEAAPELLEALKLVLKDLEMYNGNLHSLTPYKIKEVVEKALK